MVVLYCVLLCGHVDVDRRAARPDARRRRAEHGIRRPVLPRRRPNVRCLRRISRLLLLYHHFQENRRDAVVYARYVLSRGVCVAVFCVALLSLSLSFSLVLVYLCLVTIYWSLFQPLSSLLLSSPLVSFLSLSLSLPIFDRSRALPSSFLPVLPSWPPFNSCCMMSAHAGTRRRASARSTPLTGSLSPSCGAALWSETSSRTSC